MMIGSEGLVSIRRRCRSIIRLQLKRLPTVFERRIIGHGWRTRDRRAILRFFMVVWQWVVTNHMNAVFVIAMQFEWILKTETKTKMPQNEQQQPKPIKSDVDYTDLVQPIKWRLRVHMDLPHRLRVLKPLDLRKYRYTFLVCWDTFSVHILCE